MTDLEVIEAATLSTVLSTLTDVLSLARAEELEYPESCKRLMDALFASHSTTDIKAASKRLKDHIEQADDEECKRLMDLIGPSYHRWILARKVQYLKKEASDR